MSARKIVGQPPDVQLFLGVTRNRILHAAIYNKGDMSLRVTKRLGVEPKSLSDIPEDERIIMVLLANALKGFQTPISVTNGCVIMHLLDGVKAKKVPVTNVSTEHMTVFGYALQSMSTPPKVQQQHQPEQEAQLQPRP